MTVCTTLPDKKTTSLCREECSPTQEKREKMFYTTSYKRRVLLGVATWGRGCGGVGGGFCWGFFWHWKLKWWVRYTQCTYIDSVSPFPKMGTWPWIMCDGAIKQRQIRSKSCKILSHLCSDRDWATLKKPHACWDSDFLPGPTWVSAFSPSSYLPPFLSLRVPLALVPQTGFKQPS